MKRKNKGVALGMAAACSYGTNPLFALPLYALGIGVNSVLFYRYSFAVLLYGLWLLLYKKASLKISWKEAGILFFLGTIFSVSSLTLFTSYAYIGAGIASTVLFVYPIFVAVIMSLFFKEKIAVQTVVSIILMAAGIALFYKSGNGQTLNLFGLFLVMVSALSYAVYMIGLKQISAVKRMHFPKLTFYVMFFGLFVYLFNLRFGIDLQPLATPFMWGCVLGLALLPTIVSLETMTIAIKLIGPTLSAILGALEPVTAVFFGVIFFGEHLTLRICAGIALILLSVFLIVTGRKTKKKKRGK